MVLHNKYPVCIKLLHFKCKWRTLNFVPNMDGLASKSTEDMQSGKSWTGEKNISLSACFWFSFLTAFCIFLMNFVWCWEFCRLCRGLKSITDREVCCYMISCKNSTNIDTVIDWLVKHSKSKSWVSSSSFELHGSLFSTTDSGWFEWAVLLVCSGQSMCDHSFLFRLGFLS